ncbi:MAG: ExeM/NucH family extracellular endonuclease [Lacisediminihabitans sp.]
MRWRTPSVALATALALGLSVLTAPAAFAAAPDHSIAEVQGTGAATPLLGQTVTVEGVVTADYRGVSNFRGLFVQSANPSGIAGASDGVFVYLNQANPSVSIGDLVTVTGTAGENGGQTQISATVADQVSLVTAAVGVPAAVSLPDSVVGSAREAFEGMLVNPTGNYFLSSTHQVYNFGTLWLSAGALAVKSTETTDAGPQADAIAAANRASRLLVDDGYSIRVDNKVHPGTQPFLSKDVIVRNGDRFVAPTKSMILGEGFGDYRLEPSIPINDASPAEYKPTFQTENPRPETSPTVGGDFAVASFNVENYFTDFGGDARGAKDAAQFAIQKSKTIAGIVGLNASIITLEEVENSIKFGHPVDTSLADLVDGLNAQAGAGTWAYVPTPSALANAAATTDFITNAIIYKPAAVTRVGDSFADVDETVWDIAREPIAQTFNVNGKIMTVIGNHFKSKGGTGTEPADGQGQFNTERVEQANSLIAFIKTITDDPSKGENVLSLGDYNAYAQEDPIQALTGSGLVDLLPTRTNNQYTYTFDGELGSLDHAIATKALADSVAGIGVWSINSPEWSDRGYAYPQTVAGTPFRSSDHDPIKIGINEKVAPVNIDIMTINDFHGRLEASKPAAGAAVLGGMVDAYRAANPNTLFVSAGDNVGASTFTSFIQDDQPTLDALNAIGLDVSALGNHEFDQGSADLNNRIIPAAHFPYLSSNIYTKGTQTPAYPEYSLKKVGGVTVGFIGATTEELYSLVSPAGIANLDVGPIVSAVNRVADKLSDGNPANGEADVIVLLMHEGAAGPALSAATDDSVFGKINKGVDANVDAIVAGHTHVVFDHDVAVPGSTATRPVIEAGKYGENYGHLDITVDPTTHKILSSDGEVLPLFDAFAPNAEVAKIVADAVAVANVKGSVKVGEITADINRAVRSDGEENRGGESPLGNFVADVQLAATQGAGTQIALMNPGGLRADLTYASSGAGDPDGNVTYKEAASVQPFANTLVTMTLTGAQLRSVLEQQWQPASASRPFLKLGVSKSLKYTYDPAAAVGDHIDAMYVNGKLVSPTDSFKVVVNSFLATGGDNFATLAAGSSPADSGKIDLQSMVDYFTANPTVSPDYAQRAVGVSLSAPDADGYSAGDKVTIGLSSLLFSNGEPNSGTVEVRSGATVLGSAVIDPAIVDTTDEVGRASVSVTIPAGTPAGTLVLTVAVASTGTSIDVPIEVTGSVEAQHTTTRGSLNHLFASSRTDVKYTVQVRAHEGTVSGDVAIFDGRHQIATATLGSNGTVTVTLPKLRRGVHLIAAKFTGTDAFLPSIGWPSLLFVW